MNFEEIISFEALYKAHRKARLGKRGKKEVIEFEMNLANNLWQLHYDLEYKKYKVGNYHKFMIFDPKEREIQAISYRDRIVQHSICDNYLMPILENKLIYDNAACRKNKGTSFAIARLKKFICQYYQKNNDGYFIKIDIKKFFDSINHTILKEKLKKIVFDENVLELLFRIIDSYEYHQDCGLPMGNQTSQCFALLYLDSVDKFIKHKLKVKYYVRYMDDFVLIVHDNAKEVLTKIKEEIHKNKLECNSKAQIIKLKQGLSFLGWHFYFNDKIIQKIRNEAKKRILKKEITKENINNYKAYLLQGNAYSFWFQLFNKNIQ